ncbi:hypothetical protein K501DRAFT_234830 [Backusella circina FSU 941]|nr:hypothetical protein K501DRAFT_234830 [Backusella circina FSU 941]
MKSIFAALAALAISAVSAQGSTAYITSPLSGTVYTAGGQAIIAWNTPTVSTFTINLLQGASSALVQVETVATNVDATLGTYTWDIPSTLATGSDYAFGLGVSPNVSYTGQFTINAASGAVASSDASSTSAAAAVSAATTTAESSDTLTAASSVSASSAASSDTTTSGANKNVIGFGTVAAAAIAAALI